MLEHFDFEQGTEEWLNIRKMIPTASMFKAVMSKGRGKAASLTRQTYMYKLAGEAITGELSETPQTAAMKRGHVMEVKARFLYELRTGNTVVQSGFYRDGRMGCSLDGAIDEDGAIEIKSVAPHLLIDVLLTGQIPEEHIPQVQGQLLITGRKWCDFVAYYTGMPMMIVRVHKDPEYCRELYTEITKFNVELDQIVKKIEVML